MVLKRTPKDVFFDALIYLIVALLGIITVGPFLYVLMVSFITSADYKIYGITFPKHWTLANYKYVIFGVDVVRRGYVVTIFVTVVGTFLATLTTTLLGFCLTRKNMPGRGFVNRLITFTMFFSGGMIPTYLTIKYLGLMNTIWCMIFPLSYSAWNTMIMRTSISGLPVSLEESAWIDGATDLQIAFRIIIPLSKPVIATISLFYAVGFWNDWWTAFLYITNKRLYPLQMVLKDLISITSANMATQDSSLAAQMDKTNAAMPSEVMRMTSIVVAVGPILAVYPFVQKYFIRGVLVGSIKG